jgi:hypothetical protein
VRALVEAVPSLLTIKESSRSVMPGGLSPKALTVTCRAWGFPGDEEEEQPVEQQANVSKPKACHTPQAISATHFLTFNVPVKYMGPKWHSLSSCHLRAQKSLDF